MCEVFSEFGLPENICSDRGRNFLSNQFTQFLNTLGIDLTFCSAYHHSSNPAECAIRNLKNLIKHCTSAGKSWHIALLEYLATPLSTGIPSPAVMMGRDFRGLLPHLQHFLPDNTKEQLVHHHENQVHSGGHDLSDISIGSNVTFLDHSVMKCKSTGSLVATFLGTDNLRHPYNSIVYCGSSFPYSIQIVNDISTRSYVSIYTCGYPRIKAMQYKRQV